MGVKWKPFEIDLPPIIPQLNAKTFGVEHPAYGISAKKLYYPVTGGWSQEKDLKKRFGIKPEAKVVLSFTMKDIILDQWAMDIEGACERLAEYNVDYYLAPDFSIYSNYPPLDRLVNLRRIWLMMDGLQKHGGKVIPGVGWSRSVDMARQAEWCRANRPSMVCLTMTVCRCATKHKAWIEMLDKLERFQEECGYSVRFFLIGASSPARMRSLAGRFEGAIFYDAKTYRYAEFHRKVWDKKWDHSVSVKDMFAQNMEYLQWIYDEVMEEKSGFQQVAGQAGG